MEIYDSRIDTLKHTSRVANLLGAFSGSLVERAIVHDESKLESPEKEIFDVYTPKLRDSTYGSDEYKETLQKMGKGLKHHYKNNSHHPEFYDEGIDGMTLVDVVEMFMDWVAACERHNTGNIYESIEINVVRFGLSDQLKSILINTAKFFENAGIIKVNQTK